MGLFYFFYFFLTGLCPPPDPNDVPYKSSTIEILLDPIPDLFNVLTIEDDAQKRWSSFRYQVRKDAVSYTMDRLADMETAVALREFFFSSSHSLSKAENKQSSYFTAAL